MSLGVFLSFSDIHFDSHSNSTSHGVDNQCPLRHLSSRIPQSRGFLRIPWKLNTKNIYREPDVTVQLQQKRYQIRNRTINTILSGVCFYKVARNGAHEALIMCNGTIMVGSIQLKKIPQYISSSRRIHVRGMILFELKSSHVTGEVWEPTVFESRNEVGLQKGQNRGTYRTAVSPNGDAISTW